MTTWMIREDQLDPDQKHFINHELKQDNNIWLKGFAGSGKSVLLLHALREIRQKQPYSKILVVVYTHSLIDMFRTGIKELNIDTDIQIITAYAFLNKKDPKEDQYDYILCDEVQDLGKHALYKMAKLAKKVIVAGDPNQSIYDTDLNPDEIPNIIFAKEFSLGIIHRLTKSIIAIVQKLLPDAQIWSAKRDLTKQDVSVRLCDADDENAEVTYVYEQARKSANIGDITAILVPNHKDAVKFVNLLLKVNDKNQWKEKKNSYGDKPDYCELNAYMKLSKMNMQFVGSGYGSLQDAEINHDVIIMTYHSSKGLDFDNVFLPFLNKNLHLPMRDDKKRVLLMVAMTRSKRNLYLTYSEGCSPLIEELQGNCVKINISSTIEEIAEDFEFDF